LVKPTEKAHYDALVVDLEKHKQKAITALQSFSKVKKTEIESQVSKDFGTSNFIEAIRVGLDSVPQEDLSAFIYNVLFNSKALEVIQSPGFQSKASEFNQRYEELFQLENTIYKKGCSIWSVQEMLSDHFKKNAFLRPDTEFTWQVMSNLLIRSNWMRDWKRCTLESTEIKS
jgi:hypothetical protein